MRDEDMPEAPRRNDTARRTLRERTLALGDRCWRVESATAREGGRIEDDRGSKRALTDESAG